MSSQHLPGRHRYPGPGVARALYRPTRARHQLFLLCRRRSARVDGAAWFPQIQRHDRPHRPPRHGPGDRTLEGQRHRSFAPASLCGAQAGGGGPQLRTAGPSSRQGARQRADRGGAIGTGRPRTGADRAPDPQRPSHRGCDAVGPGRTALWPRWSAAGHDLGELSRDRRTELRRLSCAWRDARAVRRRQRLCRQGVVGRPPDRSPAARGHARAD